MDTSSNQVICDACKSRPHPRYDCSTTSSPQLVANDEFLISLLHQIHPTKNVSARWRHTLVVCSNTSTLFISRKHDTLATS
jgi:hypothetical protein